MRTSALAALVLSVSVSSAMAQDFKVTTKVFVDDGKRPVRENDTFFYGGRVFDSLAPHRAEFTVLDVRTGRIILLDASRKVKATLSLEGEGGLTGFTAQLKARAGQVKDDFFLNPQFDQTYDEATGELTLSSDRMSYRVRTSKPRYPQAVAQYREFADWFARLNAVRPRNLPPFARLKLNEALATRRRLPEEVELTLVDGNKRLSIRAEHDTYWVLSRSDVKRCETIAGYVAEFKSLPLTQFLLPAKSVAGKPTTEKR